MYVTMERIMEVMVERIPTLSERSKTYIRDQLVWQWNSLNAPIEWNEEEAPLHLEDYPEEPWGVQRNEW